MEVSKLDELNERESGGTRNARKPVTQKNQNSVASEMMVQQSKLSNTSNAEWNSNDLEMTITKMAVFATEVTSKDKKNNNSNFTSTQQCGEDRERKVLGDTQKRPFYR